MVGRVAKSQMYDRWRYFRYVPDLRTAKLWFRTLRHDKRPQAVLQALVDRVAAPAYCTDTFLNSMSPAGCR